ncbi:hypothetical protein DY000_02000156 [Brassica cretica]|uniref:Uncharacterized protein n=1 Tax=Brassica cretica TaxID=69181 RepID=A0ABQ7C4T9_BRACR|nr:hypothetical protein DY000_02000156 [Brassica cretica]
MEEEKLEVEMLVEKKRWRHGYGGKHNVYGGHASGSGRGRVLCGGEGGRAGRGAVDVDQKLEVEELMAEEEELMASVEVADVDMKVVVAKEVLYPLVAVEPEAGKDQGTRGGERSTVIPSSGGRRSGGGEAYGGGGVYSRIVMEVVVVKEMVWWYKRKISEWWLRR